MNQERQIIVFLPRVRPRVLLSPVKYISPLVSNNYRRGVEIPDIHGPKPTKLLPGAIILAKMVLSSFWLKTIANFLSLLGSRAPSRALLMASGLLKCERDDPLTLSSVCSYVLLPPVT